MDEVQVGYKMVVEGVIGINPNDWVEHDELEDHLNNVANVSLRIEGDVGKSIVEYHPDGVECEWLDTWE
jgi:hypothetical protein